MRLSNAECGLTRIQFGNQQLSNCDPELRRIDLSAILDLRSSILLDIRDRVVEHFPAFHLLLRHLKLGGGGREISPQECPVFGDRSNPLVSRVDVRWIA